MELTFKIARLLNVVQHSNVKTHWIYVCDGKWDCAEGFDEKSSLVCGNQIICKHMYKCKNMSHTCLHLGNVCDGKK